MKDNIQEREDRITRSGYTFKFDSDNDMYECRGDVCYDDEHDETPDPDLWKVTKALAKELGGEASYSEKGWQEIQF